MEKPEIMKPKLVAESSLIGGHLARISWPATLTHDQYDDLEYWLRGVLRKAERSVEEPTDADE